MAEPAFEFLPNVGDEQEGLGDAGIETFRDAPYGSCAREAGQNSRDANIDNDKPVRITFDVLSIPVKEIPSIDSLSIVIDSCLEQVSSEKERDFFDNARLVINKPNLSILRIADFNTKGLLGPPSTRNSPFNALLKGSGVSIKNSETSGGSFGIGKNASFAVSDLQTVFYSTIYQCEEDESLKFAAQGKVKLISHSDLKGNQYKATGYWGGESFQAVTEKHFVPEWMQRDSRGTSIFSLGFRHANDWPERMASSLLTNFFAAVHDKTMVFEVDSGKININSNTIENMLSDESMLKAAEASGARSGLEFARELYRCIVSANASVTILDVPGLGRMRVRILVDKGLPRRIGFIRNGMLITDNLRYFDRPLARFQNSRDFVAIVEPIDDAASKLLKSLENPAHDAFSAERINDGVKRGVAVKALRKLGDLLRQTIKEVTGIQSQSSVILDELGEYFTGENRGGESSSSSGENDPENYRYSARRRDNKERAGANGEAGEEHQSGGRSGGRSRSQERGEGKGQGDGKKESFGRDTFINLKDIRNRIETSESNGALRRVFFSADVSGKVKLDISAVGLNSPVNLVVNSVDIGVVNEGGVIVDVSNGQRYSILVSFDEPYQGPIEVRASYAERREVSE
ncbi:hypothetical protein [Pseudomonas granadensis]|uniref:hypothetical protein n=1 Tax=Pseudomonas granadensis TaxID=1421430 RepID=UPI00087ABD87|nr:hypothetical protein [Pseudomonas granadensis]SDT42516.1 hypothetical protein SAMN05216579_3728 [Pseudomonas granadensis]